MGDSRKVESAEHRSAHAQGLQVAAIVADATVSRVLTCEPPQRLAIRAADLINSEDKHGATGRLGSLDHRARHVPVGAGVELEPDGFTARRVRVLDRSRGVGRENQQVPLRSCRASGAISPSGWNARWLETGRERWASSN